MTGFFLAAAAMLVAALALILVPLLRRHTDAAADRAVTAPATITGVITAIVVPIVAVGLYLGITSYPWRGHGSSVAAPSAQPASIEEAIAKIEARLATHPDDATGWRMLGRSRVMTGQYAQAVTAYDKAIELTGGLDPGLRLDLAEALVLTNDAAGQARARQLVDEVLKSDPANQKALWYSGVIALRNDDASDRQAAVQGAARPGTTWRDTRHPRNAACGARGRDAGTRVRRWRSRVGVVGSTGTHHPRGRLNRRGPGIAPQDRRAGVRLRASTRHPRPAARSDPADQ